MDTNNKKQRQDDSARSPPSSSPPPSSFFSVDGKKMMSLKVKAPAPPPVEEAPKIHQCVECNKTFNNGKALGGHMSSAHVQANKDYSFKKLKSKKSSGPFDDLICQECGKDFPSSKSLFGHMRCHPTRPYRGMEPPASMPNMKPYPLDDSLDEAESDDDYYDDDDNDDEDVAGLEEEQEEELVGVNEVEVAPAGPPPDLMGSLTGWAMRDRRGRAAMSFGFGSSSSSSRTDLESFYRIIELVGKKSSDEGMTTARGNGSGNAEEGHVVGDSRKRKRDSSLRICEPDQAAFESNYHSNRSHDESSNCTNVSTEPIEVTRGMSRMEASDQEGIQENVGCSKSLTSTKSKGRENGHMDTREYPRVMSVEKEKAKCSFDNGMHMNLEERRAMYRTSSTTDKDVQFEEEEIEAENNELLEGEMEVAKDEPLEEGEIAIQEDEELEKREAEARKYAQSKPLRLGGAKYRRNGEETTRIKFAKRTKRTSTDQTTENSSDKYICEVCKKSFPSHQALGGHRSSHNKFKISIENTNDELSPMPKSSRSKRPSPKQGAAATATNGEDNSSSHICNICNRTFSSGRALGGHKRSHTDQGSGSGSSHSKLVASDEKEVETASQVFFFDLNKTPDEKDEEC